MAKRHYIPVTADVPGVSDEKKALIRRVIRTALAMQGVDFPCEVDVLVTSDAGIHQINLDMRQVDRPTDVLSFPEFDLTPGELPGPEDADPGTGLVPLGDMVLSMERVQKEREELLATTRETLCGLYKYVQAFMDGEYLCVIGNGEKIRENKELFYKVEQLFH